MDVSVFQDVINRIDGVISSKVVAEKNNVSEIHIVASNSRFPKQIVRDIESSLLATFDYRIDRKKISIAQIQAEDREEAFRIRFLGVTLKTFDNTIECSVRLTYKNEEFSVTQVGINTASNRKKTVADATVKSVEKILGQAFVFDIQDVMITTSNDTTFVSVLVNMILSGKEETMVGSAIARDDINNAIAKAALDAVNRRIQKANF
jgi:hypothetical protein